jgi:putative OPT family oligopeptide transporter
MIEKSRRTKVVEPYVPASKNLPEITIKAFILSVILAVVMAASNAYLGLKMGMTVAATIPAAIISMGVLRLFKKSNILENNIVQTTASVGECLAAAAAFTLPALVMMRFWTTFNFWQTALTLCLGGVFGVLFSIPIRRALVVDAGLKFPEGTAAAEILKVGDGAVKSGLDHLLVGGAGAALLKLGQSGLGIFGESLCYWQKVGGTFFGFGTGLAAAFMGAGYITGVSVGISLLIGAIITWNICVPMYAYSAGIPEGISLSDVAMGIWAAKCRIIGVGAMVVGGVWTVIPLLGTVKEAISASFKALKASKLNKQLNIATVRTERDIPITYVGIGILMGSALLFLLIDSLLRDKGLVESAQFYWSIVGVLTLSVLVLGFLASVIMGYVGGTIGSSCSPVSGIAITGVVFMALILFILVSPYLGNQITAISMAAVSVLLGSIVASMSVISLDNLQDLKAGQIVGATPWKQQVMLIVGSIVAALVMAPVLNVLFEAYGMGDVFPREGMDVSQVLSAPKAALMGTVARGVFDQSLDWSLLSIGAAIGVFFIFVDSYLKAKKSPYGISVLTIAVGIYMPLDITGPVLIGGLLNYFAEKRMAKHKARLGQNFEVEAEKARQKGLLTASGAVAGEALVGVLVAILIVTCGPLQSFIPVGPFPAFVQLVLGAGLFAAICWYLFNAGSSLKKR